MPVFRLTADPLLFPPAGLAEPDGLLAVGGDLSPERLRAAYRQGIFPWFSQRDLIFWFSPDPRFVLLPKELKVSESMRRILKSGVFTVTFNTAFREVISECRARKRKGQKGTWITRDFVEAYCRLHEMGVAQSVEVYRDGTLAGGLYGLKMGRLFFGESMFYKVSNASKAGFITFVEKLREEGCALIDCQTETPHLVSMGAKGIPREEYLSLLKKLTPLGSCGGRSPLSTK